MNRPPRQNYLSGAGVIYLLLASLALGELPPLTKREVARITDAFAMKEGVCLKCYQRPIVRYHKAKEGNYWTAHYAPVQDRNRPAAADADFSIRVDEASRIASDNPLR